ncbi:MAG: putative DNA-binding domain-containing protein [Burkholderiaceae bacterium]|nr:putative DNA-binding domain-containing protein [Burkholderiaceae bacterium]
MTQSTAQSDDLESLQRRFQDYVLHGNPAVLQHVAGATRAAIKMDIYAEGYPLRLLEALATDYPGLKAIAGEEFNELGRAYIAACPSTLRNLRWYGEKLAQFLESTSPWSIRSELADMARFEWAMGISFDALDSTSLTREALSGIGAQDWSRLIFLPHPATRCVVLTTDVPRAWSAQARGEALAPVQHEPVPAPWLLTRRDLQVRFRAMGPQEAEAFDRLAARVSFGQWCAELGEMVGEENAAGQAVKWLNQWLADGALAGVTLQGGDVDGEAG